MIELHHIGFSWLDGAQVFDDLSFSVAAGEKMVLLGANGCGKSTLLQLLDGLIFAERGGVYWQGEELKRSRLQQRDFARRFRSQVGLLFQHPEAMLFNPTVREEIAYGPRQLGLPDTDTRVASWAGALRLGPLLDKAPFSLSGGEKQKVALASLLALEPQLLLLDEPAASLDPATAGWLVDTLLDSTQTVIVSTHNLSMAAELGSRCLVLGERGEILFDGPVEQALRATELLEKANLAHRHKHRHGGVEHVHVHAHDWDTQD
ncbi:ABC transporter [Sulfuricella sp. T08]|uniref:energy-coupling factor ABC transporter ATP-binding protein n=1 Tax=Sulfuricella sp. T08 TaxID=1632857 RepID=UPI0006179FD4|nr:ABC transporter ATP-binding protein [Sulfuricella sp. T08]GAO34993.1 ABC transporter [Sulfuricella sp. T08]